MRILFFLEPVVFRSDPLFLKPHLWWFRELMKGAAGPGNEFALATSQSLCDAWTVNEGSATAPMRCFPLDGSEAVAPFDSSVQRYSAALYGDGLGGNPLLASLGDIDRRFMPDLVVLSSQNAYAARAFVHRRCLYIEQAPLPRVGQPHRLALDPFGHQVGSTLERYGAEIRSLPLLSNEREGLLARIHSLREHAAGYRPADVNAVAALRTLAQGQRVALLALQPRDWVTFEGALKAAPKEEELLRHWSQHLPHGWIGVPTYHPHARLSVAIEQRLLEESPLLRFLPGDLAQGTTEALLTFADAVVTVSSSTAMTALLFGRRAVVSGRGPVEQWCARSVSQLDEVPPLLPDEIASTLKFLTHRYTFLPEVLSKGAFGDVVQAYLKARKPEDQLFDMSTFSLDSVDSLLWTNA
jgi:hypothetical protein